MIITFRNVHEIIKSGYGLSNEDLDEFINNEKCLDISSNYSDLINDILEKLSSKSMYRLIKYNRKSGFDDYSKQIFNNQFGFRSIFYLAFLSNRETCVVFVNEDKKDVYQLDKTKHLLSHEFAHHFEITEAGIPRYRPINGDNLSAPPPFANVIDIGKDVKSWYIDGVSLGEDDKWIPYMDSIERMSDVCSEKILSEHKVSEDAYQYFLDRLGDKDPADPRHSHEIKRYIRRLSIRDTADMLAMIKFHNSSMDVSALISNHKKRLGQLNKKYISKRKTSEIFDYLFELSLETNLEDFKDPIKYEEKMEDIFNALRIKYVI